MTRCEFQGSFTDEEKEKCREEMAKRETTTGWVVVRFTLVE